VSKSKRQRKGIIPFPAQPGTPKVLERVPLSDADRHLWVMFRNNLERNTQLANASINQAAQQALQDFAGLLIAKAGKSPDDGWLFNVAKGRLERYPLPPEDSGT
jgi:hypothetical protein